LFIYIISKVYFFLWKTSRVFRLILKHIQGFACYKKKEKKEKSKKKKTFLPLKKKKQKKKNKKKKKKKKKKGVFAKYIKASFSAF
jgi:prophage tail gpP-like protein